MTDARTTIENLWDRATPVAPLLDAYRAEILREAADRFDEFPTNTARLLRAMATEEPR